MSESPARLSHLLMPLSVETDRAEVARSLDALFHASGPSIDMGEKRYFLRAFETHEAAVGALMEMGPFFSHYDEKLHTEPVQDFQNADSIIWVSIMSPDDPTPAVALQRETFQYPDFMAELLDRMATNNAFLLADLQKSLSDPHEQRTVQDLLLTLALSEIKQDIAVDLSGLPYSETVDLSGRDIYVKDVWGVNPVDAVQGDDIYAALHAVEEANNDNDWSAESEIFKENGQGIWDNEQDELEPLMTVLGMGEAEVVEELESWTRSITEFRGVRSFELSGNLAIAAIPFLGKEPIYISFDGVTSTAANGVVDENYLAMLDLLRVDPRSWVDHLLERAGLPKADWSIDVSAIIDRFRPHARIDEKTGVHWDSDVFQDEMKIAIMDELFPSPDEPGSALDVFVGTEAGVEFNALKQKRSTTPPLSDAEVERYQVLGESYRDAVKTDEGNAWREEHREYVFDIALEVFKAQMDDLGTVWCTENGIDVGVLRSILNSSKRYEMYPQLAKDPDYSIALANLGMNCNGYEWMNPPHQTASKPAMISHKMLCELLENCMYDGNLVVAFQCDMKDLEKIGHGMQDDQAAKKVTVSAGYVHIHNYVNGAGNGEALDGDWSFTTDDLRAKRVRMDNDSTDRYGIQDVFGQFLASRSSVSITDLVPVADVPDPVFYRHQTLEGKEVIINTSRVTAWAKLGLAELDVRITGLVKAGEVVPAATELAHRQLSILATGNTPMGVESMGRAEWDAIKTQVHPDVVKAAARSFSEIDR